MILDFSQKGYFFKFEVDDEGRLCLDLFSKNEACERGDCPSSYRSAVNVHLSGKNQNDHHFAKHTGCSGDFSLKYKSHEYYDNAFGKKLEFTLEDEEMRVVLHYQLYSDTATVRSWSVVTNTGSEPLGLEYVSSFAYTGFNDGEKSFFNDSFIYIPNNYCIREHNWKKYRPRELGFTGACFKRLSISNTGTWSTKEYLPMGAVENTATGSTYLFQIEANGSWQWELSFASAWPYGYIKLSGPTENENGWHKELLPGESFETVKAAVSVGRDFDGALEQMTAYRRHIYTPNRENSGLPVIFNDYMNCLWAKPTEENELPIIELAAETGAEYYCMDAGWYSDGGWWDLVGEWIPSEKRFPNGIKKVFDAVRAKGMVPGIWLEIEVMGVNCPLAKVWPDECFFVRHGRRVIDHGRYLLDFRCEKVREHASATVRRLVKEYGIGYIKMDFNVEGGSGTELFADSVGDGLLGHNRALSKWHEEIAAEFPELIIESCASGGNRADYLTLSHSGLISTSDQTDYRITSVIAAASTAAILPEQAAVWAYPKTGMDRNATSVNMVNSIFRRIHLSGEIFNWTKEQMETVKEGVRVYKQTRALIPESYPFFPLGMPQFEHDIICSAFRTPNSVRLSLWRHEGDSEVFIPLEGEFAKASILYPSATDAKVELVSGGVRVELPSEYSAVAIELPFK